MMMFHHYNRHNDERTTGTSPLLSCCLYSEVGFYKLKSCGLRRGVAENILFPIFVNVNYLTTFIVVPLFHANGRNIDLWENNRGLEKA